ncbi:unnamed protein product [Ectocarpus sp. CCAP 1310/34]|nr:unnamed protein product [Ectocarpus sp. CCAP 1310/34]
MAVVQQIRSYLSIPRDTMFSKRPRLVLVWQSTTEADFYSTDEITAMQEKSNGLLEVTALTSEGGRRRNAPGAAFRKARDIAWNVFGSPAPSNTSSANPFTPAGSNLDSSSSEKPKPPPYPSLARDGGRDEQPPPYRTPGRDEKHTAADAGTKKERAPKGIGNLLPTRTWRNVKWKESPTTSDHRRAPMQDTSVSFRHVHEFGVATEIEFKMPEKDVFRVKAPHREKVGICVMGENYQVGDGLVRGRVNREILENVFGEALLSSIAAYNRQRALNSLACSDSDVGDEKEGQGEDDGELIGTDQTAGKLQVVVSGPTAFVANVKQLLTQMGVPAGSTVLLD